MSQKNWDRYFYNICLTVSTNSKCLSRHIGAILVKMEGLKIIYNIQTQINRGIMPAQEFLEGFLILVAGFLLITPGFLTDIVGFLLVFKSTRRFILIFIKRKIQDFINRGRTITIFYKEL